MNNAIECKWTLTLYTVELHYVDEIVTRLFCNHGDNLACIWGLPIPYHAL